MLVALIPGPDPTIDLGQLWEAVEHAQMAVQVELAENVFLGDELTAAHLHPVVDAAQVELDSFGQRVAAEFAHLPNPQRDIEPGVVELWRHSRRRLGHAVLSAALEAGILGDPSHAREFVASIAGPEAGDLVAEDGSLVSLEAMSRIERGRYAVLLDTVREIGFETDIGFTPEQCGARRCDGLNSALLHASRAMGDLHYSARAAVLTP